MWGNLRNIRLFFTTQSHAYVCGHKQKHQKSRILMMAAGGACVLEMICHVCSHNPCRNNKERALCLLCLAYSRVHVCLMHLTCIYVFESRGVNYYISRCCHVQTNIRYPHAHAAGAQIHHVLMVNCQEHGPLWAAAQLKTIPSIAHSAGGEEGICISRSHTHAHASVVLECARSTGLRAQIVQPERIQVWVHACVHAFVPMCVAAFRCELAANCAPIDCVCNDRSNQRYAK